MKPTFWIVLYPTGHPAPHSFAIHRATCLKRFLADPDFGQGNVGDWAWHRLRGYRAVRCGLEITQDEKTPL